MTKKQHLKGKFLHIRFVDSVTLFHGTNFCSLSCVLCTDTLNRGSHIPSTLSALPDSAVLRFQAVRCHLCGEYCMVTYKLNAALPFRVWKIGRVRLIPRGKLDTDQEVSVMYLHTYIHTYLHRHGLLWGLVKEKACLKSHEIKKLFGNRNFGTQRVVSSKEGA